MDRSELGPRLLIRFLQDAAGRGDLDPWDIDVITVSYTHLTLPTNREV